MAKLVKSNSVQAGSFTVVLALVCPPEFLIVKMGVATPPRPGEEGMGQYRARAIEGISVAMESSVKRYLS